MSGPATEDDFRTNAACNAPGIDTAMFYPFATGYRAPLPKHNPESSPLLDDEHLVAAAALRICSMCPVREACLDEALARREPEGIWGGATPTERRLMLRVHRVRR